MHRLRQESLTSEAHSPVSVVSVPVRESGSEWASIPLPHSAQAVRRLALSLAAEYYPRLWVIGSTRLDRYGLRPLPERFKAREFPPSWEEAPPLEVVDSVLLAKGNAEGHALSRENGNQ